MCDEGLGLSPVRVGAAELSLSRDCFPPYSGPAPPFSSSSGSVSLPQLVLPELLGLSSWPGMTRGDRPQFQCRTGLSTLLCTSVPRVGSLGLCVCAMRVLMAVLSVARGVACSVDVCERMFVSLCAPLCTLSCMYVYVCLKLGVVCLCMYFYISFRV